MSANSATDLSGRFDTVRCLPGRDLVAIARVDPRQLPKLPTPSGYAVNGDSGWRASFRLLVLDFRLGGSAFACLTTI